MARVGVAKKKRSPTVAELNRLKKELKRVTEQLEARERELAEATEQQTATGEILRVIANSPNDIQPVLDTVIANAVKLSGATKGHIRRLEDGFLHVVAHCNETAEQIEHLRANPIPLARAVSMPVPRDAPRSNRLALDRLRAIPALHRVPGNSIRAGGCC